MINNQDRRRRSLHLTITKYFAAMRKIEKEMLQAICNRENFCKSNTKVLVNAKCVYVKLYDTIIYILRNGIEYFSDGGFNTVTTSSRLRALGANYSTNKNKNKVDLLSQKEMYQLCRPY